MCQSLKILHLEDIATDAELVSRELKKQKLSCEIKVVASGNAYEEALESYCPDVVLSDHTLPAYSSFQAFDVLKRIHGDVPFILVTGSVSEEFAVESIKLGVDDYIVKDRLHRLPAAVDKAYKSYQLKKQKEMLLQKEKENKDAILKLSERLVLATKAANIGIWDWSIETNRLEVDDTMYRLFGFTENTLHPAETWVNYLHPDDKPRIMAELTAALKGEGELDIEYRIIWTDGSIHHCKTVGAIHRNADGWATRMVGTCWDITAQKETEQTIKEQATFVESLLESTPDGIVGVNEEGNIVLFNRVAEQMFGYSSDEILGKEVETIIPEKFVEQHRSWRKQSFKTPSRQDAYTTEKELFGLTKKGKILPLQIAFGFVDTNKGKVALASIRDITDLKEAEKAEAEAKATFAAVFEQAHDAIIIADDNGKYLQVNAAAAAMLGYTVEELTSLSAADVVIGLSRDGINLWNKFRNDGHQNGVIDLRRKDGETITCIYNAVTNILPGKHLSILTDITERIKAEKALIESEARLRAIIETEPEGIQLRSVTGELLILNPSALAMMEADNLEEAKKTSFTNLAKPHCKDKLIAFKQKVLQGQPGKIEFEIVGLKGTPRWLENNSVTVNDSDGNLLGVLCVMRDVTERKLIEEELKKNNERYELVTKASNDVIWEWNIKTDDLYFTDAYTKVFGHPTHEDWPTYQQRIHPEDKDRVIAKLNALLETPSTNYWEDHYRYLKADGNYAFVYDRGYIATSNAGIISRFVGAITDVTAKKKAEAERELIVRDILQRNKDLEQFAYIVSHNLRAPVANILGLTKLLCGNSLPQDVQSQFIEALGTSAEKLDVIIKDLSEILQVGKTLEEKKQPINFDKIVQHISESVHTLVRSEKVQIVTDFSEVKEITSLKSYVFSIFDNLIINAIKYRKPDVPPVIELRSEKHHDQVIIRFKDNGMGIDLDRYGEQVFGLYKRFHTTIEGKGMGLFMIKKQIEALGGSISVTSKVNEGTEFTVMLPM
jgi:PAS domain S-box-containing protein